MVRFQVPGQGTHLGVVRDGQVYDATAAGIIPDLSDFLRARNRAELLERVLAGAPAGPRLADLLQPPAPEAPHLLIPVDQQEIWAAGVTYPLSRDARMRESAEPDVYEKVYSAARPELFLKATPHRAVGPGQPVTIRGDSGWDVPEPELVLVISPDLEIVGYTVGNDVSSRSIEGENPLYIPQAKIWMGSGAVGPAITLAEPGLDPREYVIQLVVYRGQEVAYAAEVAVGTMNRPLPELVEYLGRYNRFPNGVLLMTGTALVPDDSFTLQSGDRVEITIPGIGTLANPVAQAAA